MDVDCDTDDTGTDHSASAKRASKGSGAHDSCVRHNPFAVVAKKSERKPGGGKEGRPVWQRRGVSLVLDAFAACNEYLGLPPVLALHLPSFFLPSH